MKTIKLYWNGKRLKDIYPYATRWQVLKFRIYRFFRKVLIGALGLSMAYGLFVLGTHFSPSVVYSVTGPELAVVEKKAPIMERIAQCESRSSQTCTDDLIAHGMCSKSEKGQILVRANNNKTIDVGKYQVNEFYWGSKATELGYNIFSEQGNTDMANWIYANKGTGDWSASSKCWSK